MSVSEVTVNNEAATRIAELCELPVGHVLQAMESINEGDRHLLVIAGAGGPLATDIAVSLMARMSPGPVVHHSFLTPVWDELEGMLADARRASLKPMRTQWMLEHYHDVGQQYIDQLALKVCSAAADPHAQATDHTLDMLRASHFLEEVVRTGDDRDYWVRRCLRAAITDLRDGFSVTITDVHRTDDIMWLALLGGTTVKVKGHATSGQVAADTPFDAVVDISGLSRDAAVVHAVTALD